MQTSWSGTVSGKVYQLEYTADLVKPSWQSVGGPATAVQEQIHFLDPGAATATQRHYRAGWVVP